MKVAVIVTLSALTAACALVMIPRADSIVPVEAVVVLGGADGERFELGYRLAQTQDVPLVLSASAVAEGERAGLVCGRDAICFQPSPYSTAGEAQAATAIAESKGWTTIAVATTGYHANRARVLFEQCFAGDVSVLGAEPRFRGTTLLYRQLREIPATVAALSVRRAC